jgi:hypothetical protein
VLPSGRPTEESETIESADPTWQLEYDYFKSLCATGGTNVETDRAIQAALAQVAATQEGAAA